MLSKRDRERETEREREKERERQGETERDTERHREKETERDRERELRSSICHCTSHEFPEFLLSLKAFDTFFFVIKKFNQLFTEFSIIPKKKIIIKYICLLHLSQNH